METVSRRALVGEIKNSLAALIQIAKYYEFEDELNQSIDESLTRMKEEGLIESNSI